MIQGKSGETGIWHRNYYEHIIRDEKKWDLICRYNGANLHNWGQDEENPARVWGKESRERIMCGGDLRR